MECNKDEALRAKTIAEKKLLERDFAASNKFALKAQRLYPKLDGLYQFLVIIDVYVSCEKKINGQLDYYKILGVDPLADEEALRKQYKKMALALHPDKNKFVEAGEAFKIMSQAWSVLSDKNKRNAYDLKINVKASNPQSVPTRPHTPYTPTNKPQAPTYTPFTSTTKPNSVPIRPHTPCTPTYKPQTRTHTPVTPKSVPTRQYSPCTATSKPQTPFAATTKPKSVPTRSPCTPTNPQSKPTPVATTTKSKSVPTRSHVPFTATNPQSKPTQKTTKPHSVPTRPPCKATKPQTQTHTPVTATKPKSVPTRSYSQCTATNPQTRTHTPVTATTKAKSVPAPTQHTTYTYNFEFNIIGSSRPKPTQNTAARPQSAPITPCTATKRQTPTHTPATATGKPKSVPIGSHAPVTATKRKCVPTPTQHTQGTGTATKRKCIPTPAQHTPATAFKCKSVTTDQSQSRCAPTNLPSLLIPKVEKEA